MAAILNSATASDFTHRVSKARQFCFSSKHTYYHQETFHQSFKLKSEFYKPSKTQKLLGPVFIGIFDRFGSVVQGMITGDESANVKYYLKSLGREAKRYAFQKNFNVYKSICLASCITNNLLETDPDTNPFESLDLAIVEGRGFCRHFALTTLDILKSMNVKISPEYSLNHMFLKFKQNGIEYYFDPSVNDGRFDCNFINSSLVK